MGNRYGIIRFTNPRNSGGFFSNYFSALSSSERCMRNNLIPYVDATNTWFNPTCNFEQDTVDDFTINPWNWWFKQSLDKEGLLYEMGIDREPIVHNPLTFNTQTNLDYFRGISDTYFQIQDHILEEEEIFYRKYLENRINLAILARGTEMLLYHPEYPKVKLQDWSNIVEMYLKENPNIDNIFLVSDDNEIIDTITNKFPDTVYLRNFFRKTTQSSELIKDRYMPWWLNSPIGDPNHRRRLGEECLIQARLLSRCQYFLGTCSGISNAVQFFNSNNFIKSSII